MANEDERIYNDKEFALILSRATELSESADSALRRRTGLSLDEIKAIATEAGFKPASIERAARQLPLDAGASAAERALGGPLKHERTAHLAVPLTEERAAHLLAIVRAALDQHGVGDASAGGMSWNSAGDGSQIFVTAHHEKEGTRVRVALNRQETLALTGFLSVTAGLIVPFIAAAALGYESNAVNATIFAGGLGGSLATARAFWSYTSERCRRRANELIDLVAGALDGSSMSGAAAEAAQVPDQRLGQSGDRPGGSNVVEPVDHLFE
jgi:hypothetical protein